MKRFTDNQNEKQNHYSGDQKLYNEIYNLIEETLTPKMDNEDSDKISLLGKETLVKELSKIVENEIIKTKIQVLESFKKTPNMIKETIEKDLSLEELVYETTKVKEKETVNEGYFSRLDAEIKEEAINEDDVNEALRIIQDYIGQKYGDIAGVWATEYDNLEETWANATDVERLDMIESYLAVEDSYKGLSSQDEILLSVDGAEPISLEEFIEINSDSLLPEEIEKLEELEIGEEFMFGGGAAAESIVKRV